MFTGLIEGICEVKWVSRGAASGGGSLTVELGDLAEGCCGGDSIAISGVCLTAARLDGTQATFGLSPETMEISTLASLAPAARVNVERAMKATDRFGGHIVQGHVDGVAAIRAIRRSADFADIEFAAAPQLLEQMVLKGSVAVDGVSLTVAGIDPQGFRVAAIPETLGRTTLGSARIGQRVNIETDVLVKIVRRQLETMAPRQEPLTVERLRQMGF
jgi:riboflavin synthase